MRKDQLYRDQKVTWRDTNGQYITGRVYGLSTLWPGWVHVIERKPHIKGDPPRVVDQPHVVEISKLQRAT